MEYRFLSNILKWRYELIKSEINQRLLNGTIGAEANSLHAYIKIKGTLNFDMFLLAMAQNWKIYIRTSNVTERRKTKQLFLICEHIIFLCQDTSNVIYVTSHIATSSNLTYAIFMMLIILRKVKKINKEDLKSFFILLMPYWALQPRWRQHFSAKKKTKDLM